MMAQTRTASVVIVTYRRPQLLVQTVRRLRDLFGSDLDIVVVDQAPAEDVTCALAPLRVRYRVRGEPNMVAARNEGILAARGDVTILLDDDVIAAPGLIEAHLAAYQDPQVGATAGHILEIGERDEAQLDPRALDSRTGWRYIRFNHQNRMDVMHARGCNMSVRKDLVLQLGGMDTNHFRWRDDSDLCFRVRRLGYRVAFEPAASVTHLGAGYGGTRVAVDEGINWSKAQSAMYLRYFVHYRDNLYFLCKFFRGHEFRQWLWDAYRLYVADSPRPLRFVAKNVCFIAALAQAWTWSRRIAPPFFEREPKLG